MASQHSYRLTHRRPPRASHVVYCALTLVRDHMCLAAYRRKEVGGRRWHCHALARCFLPPGPEQAMVLELAIPLAGLLTSEFPTRLYLRAIELRSQG